MDGYSCISRDYFRKEDKQSIDFKTHPIWLPLHRERWWNRRQIVTGISYMDQPNPFHTTNDMRMHYKSKFPRDITLQLTTYTQNVRCINKLTDCRDDHGDFLSHKLNNYSPQEGLKGTLHILLCNKFDKYTRKNACSGIEATNLTPMSYTF